MSRELVTVATFNDPVEAAMARNCLESEGVSAILVDEQTIATDWGLGNAIGGIKLQVSAAQLEKAEFLLTQRRTEDADETEPIPETAIATHETAEDLRYEEEHRAPKNQAVERLFRATVFGLFFWPLQFYALWLLLTLGTLPGTLSPDRRWKLWASVLLSLPLWCLLLVSLCFISGMLNSPR